MSDRTDPFPEPSIVAHRAAANEDQADSAIPDGDGEEIVLVLEDDKDVRTYSVEILRKRLRRAQVVTFYDGLGLVSSAGSVRDAALLRARAESGVMTSV